MEDEVRIRCAWCEKDITEFKSWYSVDTSGRKFCSGKCADEYGHKVLGTCDMGEA